MQTKIFSNLVKEIGNSYNVKGEELKLFTFIPFLSPLITGVFYKCLATITTPKVLQETIPVNSDIRYFENSRFTVIFCKILRPCFQGLFLCTLLRASIKKGRSYEQPSTHITKMLDLS